MKLRIQENKKFVQCQDVFYQSMVIAKQLFYAHQNRIFSGFLRSFSIAPLRI